MGFFDGLRDWMQDRTRQKILEKFEAGKTTGAQASHSLLTLAQKDGYHYDNVRALEKIGGISGASAVYEICKQNESSMEGGISVLKSISLKMQQEGDIVGETRVLDKLKNCVELHQELHKKPYRHHKPKYHGDVVRALEENGSKDAVKHLKEMVRVSLTDIESDANRLAVSALGRLAIKEKQDPFKFSSFVSAVNSFSGESHSNYDKTHMVKTLSKVVAEAKLDAVKEFAMDELTSIIGSDGEMSRVASFGLSARGDDFPEDLERKVQEIHIQGLFQDCVDDPRQICGLTEAGQRVFQAQFNVARNQGKIPPKVEAEVNVVLEYEQQHQHCKR